MDNKNSLGNGEINFDFIESYMSRFGGGEVFISKEYWAEGIAVICINNPQKRNALSGKMMVDFRKCVSELEIWKEGKALLLCGLGVNFCSGGDLSFARQCNTSQDGFYLSYLMQDVVKRLRQLPLISVALVHGPTLGGGAEITLACDFVLVCDDVKFGLVQGTMGITTAWGGTTRLVQMLGQRKALELLLTSRILDAAECVHMGLATKVLKTTTRMEEAIAWIKSVTRHHETVIRSYKLAVEKASTDNFEDSLSYERQLFYPLWGGTPNRSVLEKHVKHINIQSNR